MLKPEDYKLGLLIKWDMNQIIVSQFVGMPGDGLKFKNQIGEAIGIASWAQHNKYWTIWWPGLNEQGDWFCHYFSKVNEQ